MKKVLGIITARGGSKGIHRKNIKELLGKPLIVYTIEAAQKSNALDRLILSTDDPEIAEVAKKYGCEVPFLRPKELAEDKTAHLPVIKHAVTWLKEKEGYHPDYVMILQPTSPLRQPFHIREAVELIFKSGADSVLGIVEIPDHFSPYNAMVMNKEKFVSLLNGDPVFKRIPRRQDIPKTYFSAGSIYLFKLELILDSLNPNFYGNKTAGYLIDKKYSVNIDTPEDWVEAEKALRNLENEK